MLSIFLTPIMIPLSCMSSERIRSLFKYSGIRRSQGILECKPKSTKYQSWRPKTMNRLNSEILIQINKANPMTKSNQKGHLVNFWPSSIPHKPESGTKINTLSVRVSSIFLLSKFLAFTQPKEPRINISSIRQLCTTTTKLIPKTKSSRTQFSISHFIWPLAT